MSGIRPGPLSSSHPEATKLKLPQVPVYNCIVPSFSVTALELILTTPLEGATNWNHTSLLGVEPHVGAGDVPEAVEPTLVKF